MVGFTGEPDEEGSVGGTELLDVPEGAAEGSGATLLDSEAT